MKGCLEILREVITTIAFTNLDTRKGQGSGFVLSYRGSFPYILLLLRRRIPFVIPRTSLNIGSF